MPLPLLLLFLRTYLTPMRQVTFRNLAAYSLYLTYLLPWPSLLLLQMQNDWQMRIYPCRSRLTYHKGISIAQERCRINGYQQTDKRSLDMPCRMG